MKKTCSSKNKYFWRKYLHTPFMKCQNPKRTFNQTKKDLTNVCEKMRIIQYYFLLRICFDWFFYLFFKYALLKWRTHTRTVVHQLDSKPGLFLKWLTIKVNFKVDWTFEAIIPIYCTYIHHPTISACIYT